MNFDGMSNIFFGQFGHIFDQFENDNTDFSGDNDFNLNPIKKNLNRDNFNQLINNNNPNLSSHPNENGFFDNVEIKEIVTQEKNQNIAPQFFNEITSQSMQLNDESQSDLHQNDNLSKKRKIDCLNDELQSDLNQNGSSIELDDYQNYPYSNKKRKTNYSFSSSTISQDSGQQSLSSQEMVYKHIKLIDSTNNDTIGTEFAQFFINIFSDKNLNFEQIQLILEKWNKTFLELNWRKKMCVIKNIQLGVTCNFSENIQFALQQLASCSQKAFCEFISCKVVQPKKIDGNPKLYPSKVVATGKDLEIFCEFLLETPYFELFVDELCKQFNNDPNIDQNPINYFLTFDVRAYRRKQQNTSSLTILVLYVCLVYSMQQRSPQILEKLKKLPKKVNVLHQAEWILQELEKNQDNKVVYWLSIIKEIQAKFIQGQSKQEQENILIDESHNGSIQSENRLNIDSTNKNSVDLTHSLPVNPTINDSLSAPISNQYSEQHPEQQMLSLQKQMNPFFEKKKEKYLRLMDSFLEKEEMPKFGEIFIRIFSHNGWNPEQISLLLEKWKENFSKFHCDNKIAILRKIETDGSFIFFDTSNPNLMSIAFQQKSSYFQEIFCELMNSNVLKDLQGTEIFGAFSELLLNSSCLPWIVEESLLQMNSTIYHSILAFLSLDIQNLSYNNEFSGQAISAFYVYIFYSCQKFPQVLQQLPIQHTTARAEQILQDLGKSQDVNVVRWLSLIQEISLPYSIGSQNFQDYVDKKYLAFINQTADGMELAKLFIHIFSDKNLRLEQIQAILEKWGENFSKLKIQKKVNIFQKIIEEEISSFSENTDLITLASQQIYCYFSQLLCEVLSNKTFKYQQYLPQYIEIFCRLLLNSHYLERIVNELFSQISNPDHPITYFLSLNPNNFRLNTKKDTPWQATKALYAYLFYSSQGFSQFLPLKNKKHLAETFVQDLEKSQDENAARWLSLIQDVQAKWCQPPQVNESH